MVAELEKPTVELRKNILRNKIHRDGLQFPPEVIDYIAENVNESVRDLEGIVIAIMARSTIFNKEIDLDLAQHIVHGVVQTKQKRLPSMISSKWYANILIRNRLPYIQNPEKGKSFTDKKL